MANSKKITRRMMIKQSGFSLMSAAVSSPLIAFTKYSKMEDSKNFDVIIVGGSYAGLSTAMTLGRALRKVLIIDSGLPCNRQTMHSHNFITQDGEKPSAIAKKAKEQVLKYDTVRFLKGIAVIGRKIENGFTITTQKNETFKTKRLVFATGIKDIMPKINGFSECWGISIIHCPYCHGYEVKGEKTGILANGDTAFHYAQLIRNWTDDLTIFTNGKSIFTKEQIEKIEKHKIPVIEKEINYLKHEEGIIKQVVFKDKSTFDLSVIYARPSVEQHCKIPEKLGCELTEQGLLKVNMFQETTVNGVFAYGDSSSPLRAVSYAVATGNIAGTILNNKMIVEEF